MPTPSIRLSIIIPYHHEQSKLIDQTLASLTQNVSQGLIHEIILVDDFNEEEFRYDLQQSDFILVHHHRNRQREGLIRSRLIGASLAQAEILLFMDSHVIVHAGAVETMVQRLVNARPDYLIVAPVLDSIEDHDQRYISADDNLRGDLASWNLAFAWRRGPVQEQGDDCTPRRTPVLSGSAFAMYKDDFFHYGAFDSHMDIWGGENVELSLRTWLCGGRVETLPQARMTHLFRQSHPYTFPEGKIRTILKNLKRTALLWFTHAATRDQALLHLANFYDAIPGASLVDSGPLDERRRLATSLQCKSMVWFLAKSGTQLHAAKPITTLNGSVAYRQALLDLG